MAYVPNGQNPMAIPRRRPPAPKGDPAAAAGGGVRPLRCCVQVRRAAVGLAAVGIMAAAGQASQLRPCDCGSCAAHILSHAQVP